MTQMQYTIQYIKSVLGDMTPEQQANVERAVANFGLAVAHDSKLLGEAMEIVHPPEKTCVS